MGIIKEICKCLLIMVVMAAPLLLNSCKEDIEDGFIKIEGAEEENANDVVGIIEFDASDGNWKFSPDIRYSNPFQLGDCNGADITIDNWNLKFEEYKAGCIVQGKYKAIKYKPVGAGSLTYYTLTITGIDHYVLPN